MAVVLPILIVVIVLALIVLSSSVRQVQQYEKGIVLRFGRLLPALREPGLSLIIPFADRMEKVLDADHRHRRFPPRAPSPETTSR